MPTTKSPDLTALRVLVPLDGSPLSGSILEHVRRLVHHDQLRAELHLLTVLGPLAPTEVGRVEQAGEARDHLAAAAAVLAGAAASVVTHVTEGDPVEQILEAARAREVDLVAMATHGRSGLQRLVRGSVAESVLLRSDVPVLLLNPHSAEGRAVPWRRVVVPLDGTPGSAEVLALAGGLALSSGAQVVLLHIVPALSAAMTPQAVAEGLLTSARRSLDAAGIADVRIIGRAGDPATMIQREVQAHEGDVLAMSTHGRTGLARMRYGSVAETVLRGVTCPVLAYRIRPR